MLDVVKEAAPLRRNVDISEVGDVATFLGSNMSRAVTGEILFVDNGYHILGMMASDQ
jgi:enoyl-[acyl-carrier protein] reductase I